MMIKSHPFVCDVQSHVMMCFHDCFKYLVSFCQTSDGILVVLDLEIVTAIRNKASSTRNIVLKREREGGREREREGGREGERERERGREGGREREREREGEGEGEGERVFAAVL